MEKFYSDVCKHPHILGKKIVPQEISDSILFLCSEEAKNINRSVIYVDGGYLAI